MQELIQRMTENMQLYGLSQRTQETYSYRVKKLMEYFNKPPEIISDDEIREYFLYLPVVLSREEARAILKNIRVLRHRVCLTLIYSCSLRLKEGAGLKVNQIDSKRMLIHIRGAKGNHYRYVPLPQSNQE